MMWGLTVQPKEKRALILDTGITVKGDLAGMLIDLGHRVATFSDPEKALCVAGEDRDFDAAFCSYGLGSGTMNGMDFFRRFVNMVPVRPRFVLVHKWPIADLKVGNEVVTMLQTPFSIKDIKRALPYLSQDDEGGKHFCAR